MSIKGKAYIVGIYEHPTRLATDKTVPMLHAEVSKGALEDCGLSKDDIDGFFCASGDTPGLGPLSMIDYLGLKLKHMDSTDTGGSSYTLHVGHIAETIAAGKCSVALLTLAGRPRAEGMATGTAPRSPPVPFPETGFELPYGPATANMYAMCAMRHMHEYGTTSEQLAEIKVAASHHAQHNPHAMLRDLVTVEEVVNSPMIADPLHRLDCCVISDGGGALIMANEEVARSLSKHPLVRVMGTGEAAKNQMGGKVDLTYSGAVRSGPLAFGEAGVKPTDIKYASIYDSFTITVLMQLEDLGFCEKGQGGKFVSGGNLISGVGKLPFNTDGGGLCNNHPSNRGGITKVLEAVRQLRGEAHPAVQVKNCDIALAHGTGGSLGTRHGSSTVIMERV
ncbi:MAG TPA: thiolase domain-containing protein [Stellaceae bacterium]|jgi:acetyl-CoA C-acetyltransferase|nr:thiolase domain-containing protein [Stellaceae bacterium]